MVVVIASLAIQSQYVQHTLHNLPAQKGNIFLQVGEMSRHVHH